MLRSLASIALAGCAGYGVARTVMVLRGALPGSARLERPNHRGDTVTLLEGPAYAAGALAGIAAGTDGRVAAAAATATSCAAVLGAVDDLADRGDSKGFRGHLRALSEGRVTTGLLKVAGIGAAGLGASAILLTGGRPPAARASGAVAGAADVLVSGALIAGSANLVNLLDLRPGRALKAGYLAILASGGGLRPAPLVAAAAGAGAAVLPDDLAGRSMLGDCGANALGALLGVHAVLSRTPRSRAVLLAGIVAATAASERISFTRVIESTPVLRELDALGR